MAAKLKLFLRLPGSLRINILRLLGSYKFMFRQKLLSSDGACASKLFSVVSCALTTTRYDRRCRPCMSREVCVRNFAVLSNIRWRSGRGVTSALCPKLRKRRGRSQHSQSADLCQQTRSLGPSFVLPATKKWKLKFIFLEYTGTTDTDNSIIPFVVHRKIVHSCGRGINTVWLLKRYVGRSISLFVE